MAIVMVAPLYTATHYVAPFASVSGSSTSDEDAQDATAYSNATSSGSPCTLACAMANAVAGNQVQIEAGVYSAVVIEEPVGQGVYNFMPTNSGTLGNEIVFFARYPAAYNYGSTSLYSKIDRPYTASALVNQSGAMGTDSASYIVFDGFYADEDVSHAASVTGLFGCHYVSGPGIVGVEWRRMAIDRRTDGNYPLGYNGNIFWHQVTNDIVISDCKIVGTGAVTNRNDSCIEWYSSEDPIVEYCEFTDVGLGVYVKEELVAAEPQQLSGVVIRYNKFDTAKAIEVQTTRSTYIYQNLFVNCDEWGVRFSGQTHDIGDVVCDMYNNTFYGPFNNNGALYWRGGTTYNIDPATEWRDNIICTTGAANNFFNVMDSAPSPEGITGMGRYNYNLWYDFGSSSDRWLIDTTTHTGFAAWQSAMAALGSDAYSDNYADQDVFVDPEFTSAGTDFTLADNAQSALTASTTGGPVGCYITGNEEIGLRTTPSY